MWLIAVCAAVGLAWATGMTGLAEAWMGVPLAVWIAGSVWGLVALGNAWGTLAQRRAAELHRARETGRRLKARSFGRREQPHDQLSLVSTWPTTVVTSAAWCAAAWAWRITTHARALGARLGAAWLWTGPSWMRRRWPSRALEIAVPAGHGTARAMMSAPSAAECLFLIDAATPGHALDGWFDFGPAGELRFVLPVIDSTNAAWYDWAEPRQLNYASLFTGRLDPAFVTLGEVRAEHASIARSLIEAAAVASRCPARVDVAERLLGRGEGNTDAAMAAVARRFVAASTRRLTGDAMTVAARVASAWAAGPTCPMPLDERRTVLEHAADTLGDEPGVLLRLGAVLVGQGDDERGLAVLLDAERRIRARDAWVHEVIEQPQTPFLQSEIELGTTDPMTLGRVAAGLCLIAAGTPDDRVPYLIEDLVEDLRFAGWLIGADCDRQVIEKLARRLAEQRGAAPREMAADAPHEPAKSAEAESFQLPSLMRLSA